MFCAKYYLVDFRQTLAMASVLMAVSLIGCNFATISKSNPNAVQSNNNETMQSKCKNIKIKEKPSGKELQINVERINDNEFLIKVKNLSNHKVFLAYTAREDNLVSFVSFITEIRNQNGEFVTYAAGGDATPGLHPIDPDREIGFHFFEIEKGDYRLKFRYLIDEELVSLLNDSECLFKFSDSDRRLIAGANAEIITPILKINKNIPPQKK